MRRRSSSFGQEREEQEREELESEELEREERVRGGGEIGDVGSSWRDGWGSKEGGGAGGEGG